MRRSHQTTRATAITLAALLLGTTSAQGYEFDDTNRWARTATDGGGLSQGDPTTVTWSIAPDNTTVPNNAGGTGASSLIVFFDTLYPGGTGSDLTQRPWFYLFDQSFKRWQALSGLTFVYEDDDDGASFSGVSVRRGFLNTRGDIRIGATSLDGQDGSNTIAFAYGPDYGEMVIDTDNTDLFGNTFNQSRAPRNVITHELGHALGINHLVSDDGAFLMEPSVNVGFDGPQLDDILAIHRGYGDRYEKTNNASGNESASLATPLGLLIDGVTTSVGTDADDTLVAPDDIDFVSIDDDSDTDFFSFTLDAPAEMTITLSPEGPTYNSGPQDGTQSALNTAALSDLALALFDANGTTLIAQADDHGAGVVESIAGLVIDDPGTYFIRIIGADDAPQLYQLDINADSLPPIVGDLDGDRDVDQDDLTIVLSQYGSAVAPGSLIAGDPTGDGQVGIDDLDLILANWSAAAPANLTVPEPASAVVLTLGLIGLCHRRRSIK